MITRAKTANFGKFSQLHRKAIDPDLYGITLKALARISQLQNRVFKRTPSLMARRGSTRKIKKHRLYGYDEAGLALGVSAHTVRSWRPLGLQVMAKGKPHYILGAELIRYLDEKKAKRSVKLDLDQMYCFRCKEPRKPLYSMVDYILINETRGRLTGLCEACDGGLQRFVSKGDLGKFGQRFEITTKGVS